MGGNPSFKRTSKKSKCKCCSFTGCLQCHEDLKSGWNPSNYCRVSCQTGALCPCLRHPSPQSKCVLAGDTQTLEFCRVNFLEGSNNGNTQGKLHMGKRNLQILSGILLRPLAWRSIISLQLFPAASQGETNFWNTALQKPRSELTQPDIALENGSHQTYPAMNS